MGFTVRTDLVVKAYEALAESDEIVTIEVDNGGTFNQFFQSVDLRVKTVVANSVQLFVHGDQGPVNVSLSTDLGVLSVREIVANDPSRGFEISLDVNENGILTSRWSDLVIGPRIIADVENSLG